MTFLIDEHARARKRQIEHAKAVLEAAGYTVLDPPAAPSAFGGPPPWPRLPAWETHDASKCVTCQSVKDDLIREESWDWGD